MVKIVPQADAKSVSMGWFFDPGFIQNVQRVAADVENPSMESIDSVLFALREMGYIKTAPTCEHGFSVNESAIESGKANAVQLTVDECGYVCEALEEYELLKDAVRWMLETMDTKHQVVNYTSDKSAVRGLNGAGSLGDIRENASKVVEELLK